MISAIVLYGSRARGDALLTSDVDILGISPDEPQHLTSEHQEVNIHVYSQEWMLKQAAAGGLFLLHISFEGLAMYDPLSLLQQLKSSFRFKPSYMAEVETGLRILRAVKGLPESDFDDLLRRRYFWALRTVLSAMAAERQEVRFGALDLEHFSSIAGLAEHINNRETVPFETCQRFASKMVSYVREEYKNGPISDGIATVEEMLHLTTFKNKVATQQHYVKMIK